jgi:hypothetical protein
MILGCMMSETVTTVNNVEAGVIENYHREYNRTTVGIRLIRRESVKPEE